MVEKQKLKLKVLMRKIRGLSYNEENDFTN